MKLNLGGRGTKINGFKTLDINPDVGADIVGDAGSLDSAIPSGSVDEIYSSHMLEHFPHTRTMSVLASWNKVMKEGATLWLSVPDFESIVKLYLRFGMNPWTINILYGDQGYEEAFHYICFDWKMLNRLLSAAGFAAERIESLPYDLHDCSELVDTVTKCPISINVKAVKFRDCQ